MRIAGDPNLFPALDDLAEESHKVRIEFGMLVRLTPRERRRLDSDLLFMTRQRGDEVRAEINRRLDHLIEHLSENGGLITNTSIEGGRVNEVTGVVGERFHRTMQDEFYSVTFRTRLYSSIENLQRCDAGEKLRAPAGHLAKICGFSVNRGGDVRCERVWLPRHCSNLKPGGRRSKFMGT